MKIQIELLQQLFTARYEGRLAELVRLIEARDFDGLQLVLHSLAGIAGTYGFPRITEVAREGDQQCEQHDAPGLRRTIAKLVLFADAFRIRAA
jgi:HPt (histidine-containing phosphotransfer) domain-containing protein